MKMFFLGEELTMPDQGENKKTFSIGEVREKTGLTSRQIRYYEQVGLIDSLRTNGKHRRFKEETIERLLSIKELLKEFSNIEAVREELESKRKSQSFKDKKDTLHSINYPRAGRQELTSLYPVSNRADLLTMINGIENKKQ